MLLEIHRTAHTYYAQKGPISGSRGGGGGYNASSEWGVKRKLRKLHKESEVEDNSTETNPVKREAQEDIVKVNGISQLKQGVSACAYACSLAHCHHSRLSLEELQKMGQRDPSHPFYHSPQ